MTNCQNNKKRKNTQQKIFRLPDLRGYSRITITNGNVSLSGGISVTFNATISENNCSVHSGTSASSGTIVVTAGNTDVIVQVLTSTTIVDKNNNTLSCGDLSSGTITVTGSLLMGNTVQASRIELQ